MQAGTDPKIYQGIKVAAWLRFEEESFTEHFNSSRIVNGVDSSYVGLTCIVCNADSYWGRLGACPPGIF